MNRMNYYVFLILMFEVSKKLVLIIDKELRRIEKKTPIHLRDGKY